MIGGDWEQIWRKVGAATKDDRETVGKELGKGWNLFFDKEPILLL